MIAILRNKVADHYRKVGREPIETALDAEPSAFGPDGVWREAVGAWHSSAAETAEQAEFWGVFAECLGKLPTKLREAFAARELDGATTEAICDRFEVSAKNVAVRLHRARVDLRHCLDRNWFGKNL